MRDLVSEPLPRDKQVKGFGGGDAMQEGKPLLRMKNRHVVNEALESNCVTNMRHRRDSLLGAPVVRVRWSVVISGRKGD